MLLHIKNMVCDRCILVVRQQLEHLDFKVVSISLGNAYVEPVPSKTQLSHISSALQVLGFELLDNEKNKLVESIRNIIIEIIHHNKQPVMHVNFSETLSGKLKREYSYLSRLFSEIENITIEKFIIQQKIEKVKELLQYGELNLNEISWKLGYSSSAHLSNQFKTVVGQSPSDFKKLNLNDRKPLDKI